MEACINRCPAALQDGDLQALSDATTLLAIRDAAAHLMHYGSRVAFKLISHMMDPDMPSLRDRIARIVQALQRDCDDSLISMDAALMNQEDNHIAECKSVCWLRGNSPGTQDLATVCATGVIWPTLLEKLRTIDRAAGQGGCSQRVLVIVEAAVEEYAFRMIAGVRIAVKRFCNFCSHHTSAHSDKVWLLQNMALTTSVPLSSTQSPSPLRTMIIKLLGYIY